MEGGKWREWKGEEGKKMKERGWRGRWKEERGDGEEGGINME